MLSPYIIHMYIWYNIGIASEWSIVKWKFRFSCFFYHFPFSFFLLYTKHTYMYIEWKTKNRAQVYGDICIWMYSMCVSSVIMLRNWYTFMFTANIGQLRIAGYKSEATEHLTEGMCIMWWRKWSRRKWNFLLRHLFLIYVFPTNISYSTTQIRYQNIASVNVLMCFPATIFIIFFSFFYKSLFFYTLENHVYVFM